MMFSAAAKHYLPSSSHEQSQQSSRLHYSPYHGSNNNNNHNSNNDYIFTNISMNGQRKRQRRQTAGALVSNFLTGTAGTSKKSTAQPRPQIQIPPRGIGPVQEPNCNDVLCGRGGRINSHAGNVQFRLAVQSRKKDYLAKATKKLEKAHIAAQVVQEIRHMEPGGRFLKEDADGDWYDIGDLKAIKKVGQALREDAPDIRPPGEEDNDDHDGDDGKDSDDADGDDGSKSKKSDTDAQKTAAKATSPKAAAKTASTLTSTSSPPARHSTAAMLQKHASAAPIATIPLKQAVTAVSARGRSQHHHQQQQQQYQPLAYQPLPPTMYEQVVPSQQNSSRHDDNASTGGNSFYQQTTSAAASAMAGMRGGLGLQPKLTAAPSGAAARVLSEIDNAQEQHGMFQVPPARDVAFDRTFYPPPPAGEHWMEDRSQISALSGPSTMLSGLSDPMSSLTAGEPGQRRGSGHYHPQLNQYQSTSRQQHQQQHEQLRMSQLAAIRQQWAAQQQQQQQQQQQREHQQQREQSSGTNGSLHISDLKSSFGSAGLGSSMQRSLSFPDVLNHIREDMSWTDVDSFVEGNSLVGGGIGGGSLLSGASFGTHAMPMRDEFTGEQRGASGSSKASASGRNTSSSSSNSRSTNKMASNVQPPLRERGLSNMEASVASMSMNSVGGDSLPSIANSIMSDLSESLIALDLAVPLLDR